MTIEQMFFSIFGLMLTQFIYFLNRFGKIDDKFSKIDDTLSRLNETLIRMDNRVGNVEKDLDIEKRIQSKIDSMRTNP